MKIKGIILLSAEILMSITLANASNYVILMMPARGHVFPALSVARELEKNNHSVTFVISTAIEKQLIVEKINVSIITAKSFDDSTLAKDGALFLESKMSGSRLSAMLNLRNTADELCHNVLTDKDLFATLLNLKFDVAIVDFNPSTCFEVLAYKLTLPFIYLSKRFNPVLNRMPFYPSFMPTMFSSFTDKITFSERAINYVLHILDFVRPTMTSYECLACKLVPEKPYISNWKLQRNALLHIVDSDVLMGIPFHFPPNVITCGGLTASAAKPLPPTIERFVESSKDGIVVVSFGSLITTLPDEILLKLTNTFKKATKLNFIFRQGSREKLLDNVLLLPWLPQNDLLGHPKTKLFITHCGNSGIFESMYHGVPMIGFPMGFDQPSNANIMEDKGYRISMDIAAFSSDELLANIERVVFESNFKSTIQTASTIFHSRPQTPPQRAAYWIDLITRYGSKYFRPYSLDMPWYAYYMVDIFVFYFILTSCSVCCLIIMYKQMR